MDGAKHSASPPAARADGHANDQSLMNSRRLMRAPLDSPGLHQAVAGNAALCITAILAANVSVGSKAAVQGRSAPLRHSPQHPGKQNIQERTSLALECHNRL